MKLILKKSFLLIIGLCLSYSINAMNKPELESPFNIENARTKEDFQRWLDQENANLWKELEKVYGITENRCQELKEEHKAEYEALVEEMVHNDKTPVELSEATKTIIRTVLQDFGIQEEALRVIPFAKAGSAASTDSVLFINQNCLPERMPVKVKKYLIALAVWMAKNKDHSTDFVLAKIRQLNTMQDAPELQKVTEIYDTLKALRSDIHVMFLGKEYREAQNIYAQLLNNQFGRSKENVARLIIGQLMTQALDKTV